MRVALFFAIIVSSVVNDDHRITVKFIPPDELNVEIENFNQVHYVSLKEIKMTPINITNNVGQPLAVKKVARIFEGNINDCYQCKSRAVWFEDVNMIYGTFDFVHTKLYVEPAFAFSSTYGKKYAIQNGKMQQMTPSRKTTVCNLAFVVDKSLFKYTNSNVSEVYRHVVATGEYLKPLFMSELGVNFVIDRLIIQTDLTIDSINLNGSDICLIILLTDKNASTNNRIRLFDTANGICSRSPVDGQYPNVIVIDAFNGYKIPSVFYLHRKLAFEIALNWGAKPEKSFYGDETLMSQKTDGTYKSHHTFGEHAVNDIKQTFSLEKSNCFIWTEPPATCGNNKVEGNEQCDHNDYCQNCMFPKNVQCSPNHQDCCINGKFATAETPCPTSAQPSNSKFISFCTGNSTFCGSPQLKKSLFNDEVFKTIFFIIVIGIPVFLCFLAILCKNKHDYWPGQRNNRI